MNKKKPTISPKILPRISFRKPSIISAELGIPGSIKYLKWIEKAYLINLVGLDGPFKKWNVYMTIFASFFLNEKANLRNYNPEILNSSNLKFAALIQRGQIGRKQKGGISLYTIFRMMQWISIILTYVSTRLLTKKLSNYL